MDALVIRKNQEKRWITNAINYKGYLAQVYEVGVGKIIDKKVIVDFDAVDEFDIYERYEERYRTFFVKALIMKDYSSNEEFISEIEKFTGDKEKDTDIRKLVGTKFEKYLVKIGDNGDGFVVELHDYEMEQKVEQERKWREMDAEIIDGKKAINFIDGVFGFMCTTYIPETIFGSLMKRCCEYHKGDMQDVEEAEDLGYYNMDPLELKGWYFNKQAIEALIQAKLVVSYYDEVVTSSFDETFQKVQKTKQEMKEKWNKFEEKKAALRKKYYDFYNESYYMTIEEVKAANLETEEKIIAPGIEIKGHNIYGSGMYFIKKDGYLYFIKNNGMDGDDWSRNNFETAGAGAIATRLQITEDVESWLKEAVELNFEKFMAE